MDEPDSVIGTSGASAVTPSTTCAVCKGATVEFRGTGIATEYRICVRYREPGHLNEVEIRACVDDVRKGLRPSRRFA